ncbi:small RNA 2'-O-methyltransferase isoform X2 [Dendrobates tinctorius]|uniref:small RNA 2'-O-methyltransferase isoform X2 n=1 Tax=Dendrobates tinctorius TaxID=92724 RepID=UPI003CC97E9B
MDPVRFIPPLYEQRYEFVKAYVEAHKPKKVADLGCSECTLLHKLKFRDCIEELVGVDIDEEILRRKGIEHLEAKDLEQFQDVLFGFMAPKAVVISTPNVEFNVLFSEKTRFRHPDHKFEWSRKEFQSWAVKISRQYNYTVEFTGVGKAEPETKDVGYCSQIGIFRKNYNESEESINNKKGHRSVYKRVLHVVYPSIQDEKYLRKVVLRNALSHADRLKNNFLRTLFPEKEEENENMADNESNSCGVSRWVSSFQTPIENEENKVKPPFLEGDAIHVPLETLFAIPKVKKLCGGLDVLQRMMNGEILLSSDGSAVVYPLHREDDLDSDMGDA